MSKQSLFLVLMILCTAIMVKAEAEETPGRGIVALPHGDGIVTVGWRLRTSDPADVSFNVYRQDLYSGPEYVLLTTSPLKGGGTVYLDKKAKPGHSYRYRVQAINGG